MLVVVGEAKPVRASCATGSHSGGGSRPAASTQAQAIRQGSRIAASPPGIGTGQTWPMRSTSVSEPRRSSPPQIVPSVP